MKKSMKYLIENLLNEEGNTTASVGGMETPLSAIPSVQRRKQWRNGILAEDLEDKTPEELLAQFGGEWIDNTGIHIGNMLDYAETSHASFASNGIYRKFKRKGDKFDLANEWIFDNPDLALAVMQDFNYMKMPDGIEAECTNDECDFTSKIRDIKNGNQYYKRILSNVLKRQGEFLDGYSLKIHDNKYHQGYVTLSINGGEGCCVIDKKADKIHMISPQGTHTLSFKDSDGSKDRFIKSFNM